jgi:hypothetical protein
MVCSKAAETEAGKVSMMGRRLVSCLGLKTGARMDWSMAETTESEKLPMGSEKVQTKGTPKLKKVRPMGW